MLVLLQELTQLIADFDKFLLPLFGIAVDGFLAFGQAEAVGIERTVRAGFDLRPQGLEPGDYILIPALFRNMGKPVAFGKMLALADMAVRKDYGTVVIVRHATVELYGMA